LIPGFFGKSPHFAAKCRIFSLIHENTLENSQVHPILRLVRRTETYPLLEPFLFLITKRRFGGVGAQEGREKVPDHSIQQIKKVVFLTEDYGINWFWSTNVFLAEDYGSSRIFCKICANLCLCG
jgi:hypothetical protein